MIIVDTSALMAIILGEPAGPVCAEAAMAGTDLLMAAPTITECMIVSAGRDVDRAMERLLGDLSPKIIVLNADRARAAAKAYRSWGKGFHPAALNFGDCFAYAVANEHSCPLLYVGNDFAQTDIRSAIQR